MRDVWLQTGFCCRKNTFRKGANEMFWRTLTMNLSAFYYFFVAQQEYWSHHSFVKDVFIYSFIHLCIYSFTYSWCHGVWWPTQRQHKTGGGGGGQHLTTHGFKEKIFHLVQLLLSWKINIHRLWRDSLLYLGLSYYLYIQEHCVFTTLSKRVNLFCFYPLLLNIYVIIQLHPLFF